MHQYSSNTSPSQYESRTSTQITHESLSSIIPCLVMKSSPHILHSSIYTQSLAQRKYKVPINSTRFRNQLASNMHKLTNQRSFPLPSSLQIVTSYSRMNSQIQYETNNTKIGKFGEKG